MITIQPEIEILSTESYEDMLRRIEKIGRVCYKSEERIGEGTAEKFIAGIIKRGHESVIEHGSITVKVTCDRGVTHEIVRHRIASYSQESTRYCNYSKDKFGNQITCIDLATGFSYDLDDENDRKKYEVWQKAMEAAEQYYFQMLELGAKPEEARSILPNSLKTEIVMTMSIGLAVADEIVKLHGGTLNIDSILNEGTTVTITLPIEAVSYTDEKEVQDEEEKNSN